MGFVAEVSFKEVFQRIRKWLYEYSNNWILFSVGCRRVWERFLWVRHRTRHWDTTVLPALPHIFYTITVKSLNLSRLDASLV